jgi:Bacterial PH domain
MRGASQAFSLAPMSGFIRTLSAALYLLPVGFVVSSLLWGAPPLGVGLLLSALYVWVWLWMRPSGFVVRPDAIEVNWPLRRRRILRAGIDEVRLIERAALLEITGKCMRVGVGGLWGGFGWLWTQHRGVVQMYVSRSDGLVWIERGAERPWLITPESPEAFVRALGGNA